MLQAENLLRGILRLFFWGMVVTFGVLIVKNQLGVSSLPFLQMIWRGVIIWLIMIPAVVLSGYVLCVFGIAIYGLAKVLRTNWRMRAYRLKA
jgi:hypothetical protein